MDIISAKGYSDKTGTKKVGKLMREFGSKNISKYQTRFLGD
jgi:hypothetical protein